MVDSDKNLMNNSDDGNEFVLTPVPSCTDYGLYQSKSDPGPDQECVSVVTSVNKMELLQSQAPVDWELSGSSASARHGNSDIGD